MTPRHNTRQSLLAFLAQSGIELAVLGQFCVAIGLAALACGA